MVETPKKTPQAVSNIHDPLGWISRYYKKKVLVGKIAERLKVLLSEIASPSGFKIVAVEIMPRHVHLLVSAPPKFSPLEIMRLFKGINSRKRMQEDTYLRRPDWDEKSTLWSAKYSVGTADLVSAATIQRDINNPKG